MFVHASFSLYVAFPGSIFAHAISILQFSCKTWWTLPLSISINYFTAWISECWCFSKTSNFLKVRICFWCGKLPNARDRLCSHLFPWTTQKLLYKMNTPYHQHFKTKNNDSNVAHFAKFTRSSTGILGRCTPQSLENEN